jgi:sulfite reductase beta subunit-like hemoprotein
MDFEPGPARLRFSEPDDVDRFVARLEAFERGDVTSDEWRTFRLLNGVYGQRQDGFQMIRAKLPGGVAGVPQLLAMAEVADKYGGGKGHFTTRQNIQYHFVPLADCEDALRILSDAGITTREACGPSVRNWTCCPLAGVSEHEPFDVTPYLEAVARHFLRGPYSASLPRKFKPSVGGCCGTDCSQAFINDLGLLARKRPATSVPGPADEIGFEVVAGGGLGTLRRSAITVDEFVPAAEILEASEAVVRVFDQIGNRTNKNKARLKWAIDKVGKDAFVAAYRAMRDTIRAEGGRPYDVAPRDTQTRPRIGLPQQTTARDDFAAWAADSVRPQKQRGFSVVTLRLILGDITATQLRALARLCVEYGEGEVRTTNEQNVVLRWIATWRLPLLHRELVELGLATPGVGTVVDITSCPGASSCKLAVTQSRGLASLLTDHLHAHPEIAAKAPDLVIKISGCPNSCGQHHIAGIGFQGGMRKVDGRPVPQYLIHLGGAIGPTGARFAKLTAKVPARRAPEALDRLIDLYVRDRTAGESAADFFARITADDVRVALGTLGEMAAGDATADDFIDLGETKAFEVVQMEGECAV